MIRLCIFDLDGTLLNTLEDLADAANQMLTLHGYPTHPIDAYRYFVGNGMPTLIHRILPEQHRTPTEEEFCLRQFLNYYTEHMHDKTSVYAGMTETLEKLQGQNCRLAVATNKVQSALEPLMAKFFPTIYWDALLGQRPGIAVKPDPQIVYDILKITGMDKAETIYFGDTSVDIETAHRAGLKAVGVLWGYRPRTELEEAHADKIIAHPTDILSLL